MNSFTNEVWQFTAKISERIGSYRATMPQAKMHQKAGEESALSACSWKYSKLEAENIIQYNLI